MNQAEIIGPEVQSHSSFQIGQLARESQRQPVKSSNLHAKCQILPFNVGRTDLAVIGNTKNLGDLCSRHARRCIEAWARVLRGIQLGDGRIGGAIIKKSVEWLGCTASTHQYSLA